MGQVLRLAIVDPHDGSRGALKSLLLGMERIWLEAECSRYEFFGDVVGQTQPDIALVALDQDHDKAIRLVTQLRQTSPTCSILAVSSSTDGALILKAMRAGAREFLTQPVRVDDLLGALERIASERFGPGESRSRGSLVLAVAGASGGVGSTSLAVNIGCALAKDPARTVVLVDLDLSLGDADVFLDTIPDYTLLDVAQNVTRLDFTLLKRSLTKHSSGMFLLPRPIQLQDSSFITRDDLQRVIGLLKATFTHVVLDLSKSFNSIDLLTLEMADRILLVVQLDLPTLRNVVRLMAWLGDMEGMVDKVRVIVNRVGLDSGQISLKKAQETIGRDIFWQVPNDYRTMVECRNNGVPLVDHAPKAKITHSIQGLAAALTDEKPPEPGDNDKSKSSVGKLLSFWGAKAKSGSEK